jgi:hypothetical protein
MENAAELTTAALTTNAPVAPLNVVATIDWAKPTWDLFIILLFLIAVLIYGVSLGRDRVITILVSTYVAMAVVNYAPFLEAGSAEININDVFVLRLTSFVGVFVLLFFLLSHSALVNTVASSDTTGSWWHIIIYSILQVGLLVAVVLSYLPEAALTVISPTTRAVFLGEWSLFGWIMAPVLAMTILKGGARKRRRRIRDDDDDDE